MSRETVADAGQTRILVIDDDPRIRQIIQGTLEEEGFIVETAVDGPQGVERALSTRPSLIVLDMYLPVLDGAAVAEQLRAPAGKGPPIILITANDRPEEQAQRVGAAAYLRKPFDLDELLGLVWQGLEMLPDY
jgi:two-component system response regulator MprA